MVGLATTLVLLALLLLLVVRFLPAYIKFRRLELAIPGPPSLPLLGNLLYFIGGSEENILPRIHEVWNNRTELCRFSAPGLGLGLFVTDPDDIEQLCKRRDLQDKAWLAYSFFDFLDGGLITLNGVEWRAHRKAIQPAFHPEVLDRFTKEFAEESKRFVDGIVSDAVQEDLATSLRYLAGRIFFRTALKSKVDAVAEKIVDDIHHFLTIYFPSVSHRVFNFWLWPDRLFNATGTGRICQRLKKNINTYTSQYIAKRQADLSKSTSNEDFIKSKPTLIDILTRDGTLTEADMIGEFNTILTAAVETSATALGYTFKVLSVMPDIQAKLYSEVAEVLGDKCVVEKDDLERLKYMECVIKESMRLLPAVPFVLRQNDHETTFAGHTIPAGSSLVLNILGVHRDARHWPEPLRFDPERFTPERSEGRHPYAFVPFSAGPRNCIGARYAMLVMKSILATTVKRYEVMPVSDGLTDPSKFPMTVDVASRMIGGVKVIFRERIVSGSG